MKENNTNDIINGDDFIFDVRFGATMFECVWEWKIKMNIEQKLILIKIANRCMTKSPPPSSPSLPFPLSALFYDKFVIV